MNSIADSLFSNSASKYLSKVLDEGEEKEPIQQQDEEKEAKEQLERERAKRKAQIEKERIKREKKRQTIRDKYNIQGKKPEEDNLVLYDEIEVVQEHIENIRKKNSCVCM